MLIEHILVENRAQGVPSIGPEATVREALLQLVRHRIRALPVVDPSGKLIGIFTERDALFGQCRDPEIFHQRRIGEVMTPNPISCTPDCSVQDALERMSRQNIGQLPVVENGKVVAMISAADVVNSLYSLAESEKEHLMSYIQGPT